MWISGDKDDWPGKCRKGKCKNDENKLLGKDWCVDKKLVCCKKMK